MLTAKIVLEYQKKLKSNKILTGTIFKELGIELRDKFGLTDRQAIDILNGKNDEVLKILASQDEKNGI